MDSARMGRLEARIDSLVEKVGGDIAWGRALFKQFSEHCDEDEARHAENVTTLAEIENALRDQARAQAEALEKLNENLAGMLPMMRRIRAGQVWRRTFIKCLSRWRRYLVGAGISAGAAFVWFDGHWPKIVAVFRTIRGQ